MNKSLSVALLGCAVLWTPQVLFADATPAVADSSVSKLIDQLGAPDGIERLKAVDALGAMGDKAKAAAPALLNALAETTESDHPAVREAAKHVARALNQVDPAATVPPDLLNRLIRRAKQAPVRHKAGSGWTTQCVSQTDALETLAALGAIARSVQPPLVRLSNKACVQGAAVAALKQIGIPGPESLPEVLRGLSDTDADVRQATLDYIQTARPTSQDVVLLVARALNDPVSGVRLSALEALEKIHPEGEGRLPLIAPFLKETSRDVRERAIAFVGSLGSEVRSTVPLLMEALKDSDPSLRLSAARFLAKADPKNDAMVTTLLSLAQEPGNAAGESAADVLRELPRRDTRIERALAPYRQLERRRKVQEAWLRSTPEQRQENARSLKVLSIKMASEIIDDKPVKVTRHFSAHPGPVHCWTEVSVSTGPAGLKHVWYRDGKRIKEHPLEMIDTVDHVWSTESPRKGHWKVEVRSDSATEPLATIQFSVGE